MFYAPYDPTTEIVSNAPVHPDEAVILITTALPLVAVDFVPSEHAQLDVVDPLVPLA